MSRNASWIDRAHLDALLAETGVRSDSVRLSAIEQMPRSPVASESSGPSRFATTRPASVAPSREVPPRVEAAPIQEAAYDASPTLTPAPSARLRAVAARPRAMRAAGAVAPTSTAEPLEPSAPAAKPSQISADARPAPPVVPARPPAASTAALADSGPEIPPPPAFSRPSAPAFALLDERSFERQLEHFMEWVMATFGAGGAFVTDAEGLIIGARYAQDAEAAAIPVLQRTLDECADLYGAPPQGHVVLDFHPRRLVITWCQTEYGRVFAGLIGPTPVSTESLQDVGIALALVFRELPRYPQH